MLWISLWLIDIINIETEAYHHWNHWNAFIKNGWATNWAKIFHNWAIF